MGIRSQTAIMNDRDFEFTFTNEYDNDTDATTAIITPTSGKLLKITGVYISTEGATTIGQKIKLSFATSGNTVVSFYPSAVSNTASTIELDNIIVKGAQNEALSIDSNLGDGKNYFIAVNYKEE